VPLRLVPVKQRLLPAAGPSRARAARSAQAGKM